MLERNTTHLGSGVKLTFGSSRYWCFAMFTSFSAPTLPHVRGRLPRDFVFNVEFYNSSDTDAPGGGSNRFMISASNNAGRANSFPKNPGRDPFAVLTTGWGTFEHHVYDNAGTLNVDLNLDDAANAVLHSWTPGTDPIAGVGGNRYGWFVNNEFAVFAFDDMELRIADLSAVPEPGTLTLLGFGMLALASIRLRAKKS